MIIGLVRHYKVLINTLGYWMTSVEFREWIDLYNESNIDCTNLTITDVNWDACYSSNMTRAIHTAGTIHQGEIIITEDLREIDINPFFNLKIKLHLNMWLILGRIGWILKHHSQEDRTQTMERAKKIITMIEDRHENYENVLIVSHGAFMTALRRELMNRGYKGDSFAKPKNGKIYKFLKNY